MRSPWDDFAQQVLSDMLIETPQLLSIPARCCRLRARLHDGSHDEAFEEPASGNPHNQEPLIQEAP
jgi:hypothetical protein